MNVYDFDDTIYKGDSTANFFLYCLKKHPKMIITFPSTAWAVFRFYVLKKGTKTQFKEVFYRFLKYCDVEKDLEDFWNVHMHRIKIWYRQQHKDNDVIISASPEFLLKIPCQKSGIKYLMASKVDPHSGKYTGENCHGKEKVRRFYEKFGNNTVIDEFYSDSYNDTPLAEIAVQSFMVKDDEIVSWQFR